MFNRQPQHAGPPLARHRPCEQDGQENTLQLPGESHQDPQLTCPACLALCLCVLSVLYVSPGSRGYHTPPAWQLSLCFLLNYCSSREVLFSAVMAFCVLSPLPFLLDFRPPGLGAGCPSCVSVHTLYRQYAKYCLRHALVGLQPPYS